VDPIYLVAACHLQGTNVNIEAFIAQQPCCMAGTTDSFFLWEKNVLSNAKCFHCSSTVHYLFFSTSNMSNVEYYNTWYGRKATFNLMFYQYLNNKFIDSHGHKFKTEILPNCFDKKFLTIQLANFKVNQWTVCQCLLFSLLFACLILY